MMLQDYQLVPETIVTPGSFVGLMSLYESNYLRLLQLVPEIDRIDGCYRSIVAGDCSLHLEILERSRYTVTFSLSYLFVEDGKRIADPDIRIRLYLDCRMAEAMRLSGEHRHATLRRLSRTHRHELDARWRRNMVLNKWLEYLRDQGHIVLDR